MSISKNGLFSSDQKDLFIKFTESFNKNQLIWASGYLDGLLAHHGDVEETVSPDLNSSVSTQPVLTILFGSRTGNGEGLAQKAQIEAIKQGYHVKLKSMADYNVRDLHTEKNLLV